MIELLTVVAIIAVLATLLTSALSTAKRKARQSVSVGNLRQIALAFNMYIDDQRKRPPTYSSMVREKYLTERSLICAEDKLTGNWAGLIEDVPSYDSSLRTEGGVAPTPVPPEVPHSYFKSFALPDEVWERIEKNPLAGIAACQLHGLGRQSADTPPSLYAYQGLVLRALKDSSVVTRQVFWPESTSGNKSAAAAGGADGAGGSSAPAVSSLVPSGSVTDAAAPSDLPLFLDEP